MWIVVLLACGNQGHGPAETEPACALPPLGGEPTVGDVNDDGRVDLSDALYLHRNLLSGGPAPKCEAVANLVDVDTLVEVGDATALWGYLYLGDGLPELADTGCVSPVAVPTTDACGVVTLGFDAPARVDGEAAFEVGVTLTSPTLAVEGWGLSVVASGACALSAGTTDGTLGADVHDGGARALGWSAYDLAADGAIVGATALSWRNPVALPAQDDAQRILTLTLATNAAAGTCSACVLSLADGHAGRGQPVDNIVSVAGRTYVPALRGANILVCAP